MLPSAVKPGKVPSSQDTNQHYSKPLSQENRSTGLIRRKQSAGCLHMCSTFTQPNRFRDCCGAFLWGPRAPALSHGSLVPQASGPFN